MNLNLKMRYPAILRLSLCLPALLLGLMESGWTQDRNASGSEAHPAVINNGAVTDARTNTGTDADTNTGTNADTSADVRIDPRQPAIADVGLFDRYPAGSITSVDTSNTALGDTGRERKRIDVDLIRQQRVCYRKFFVSSCLNKVQAEYRTESKKIKNIEIEANTYLRQARADDRDAALAQQRAQDLADAPRRAEEQRKNALANSQKVEESARRTAEADARAQAPTPNPDERIADHDKKVAEARARQDAIAKAHDANVAAYNKKVQDAKDRQKEVADKKAQKAADLAAQRAAGQQSGK